MLYIRSWRGDVSGSEENDELCGSTYGMHRSKKWKGREMNLKKAITKEVCGKCMPWGKSCNRAREKHDRYYKKL